MSLKINLLIKKEEKETLKKFKKFFFSGTALFLANLIIIGSSVYAYWRLLSHQVEILKNSIETYKSQISSFHEVEKRRSFLAAKLSKIEKIYAQRKDYKAAVEEIEKLFGGNLKIKSFTLNSQGEAKLTAGGLKVIKINPEEKLPEAISSLQLELIASSSANLDDFINSLKGLQSKGLTHASLASLTRTKNGNYKINLNLKIR